MMTFFPIENTTAHRFTFKHLFTIWAAKSKLVFSRRPKSPQDLVDAQVRREAARQAVNNLLR